jgi:predicted ribosome quality control (RQC) complex YloA/Tae2 family protein
MSKHEFTSFDVTAVVRELREVILNSRVNNVYQPDTKTLIFKLHKPGSPPIMLVMESGKRVHLSSYAAEKLATPPAFCMALRKYVRNEWLADVEQHAFERVVVFYFRTKMGGMRLVLELFGDGNIILLSEAGSIIQALSYKRMRDRNILRGENFAFAPSTNRNPLEVTKAELHEGLRAFKGVEVVRALARFLSIGGLYGEETLFRADVNKTKACEDLSDVEVDRIFDSLHGLLMEITNGLLEPCIVIDETTNSSVVVPLRLRRYEGLKFEQYKTFNEALDEFYARMFVAEKTKTTTETSELEREAERLKRIAADQERTLVETESRVAKEKLIGDTIYAHIVDLQSLIDKFLSDGKSGKNRNSIVSDILAEKKQGLQSGVVFESFDNRTLTINVRVENLLLSLDLRRNLYENAAQYYERGKRAKEKFEGAKTALEDTRQKLAQVQRRMVDAEKLREMAPVEAKAELAERRIKPRQWYEKFRWFTSSDGFLVVAGKDAVSNEVLIKRNTETNDVVFHADIIGAAFVVVKTEGRKPSEQCLREAGEFAAAFSRGWREGFGSVDVYWVRPEQLGKGGASGESVGHGAFIVHGERNWMRNTPLRLAIGTTLKDDHLEFINGPSDAVKSKTNTYITIVPGDESGKALHRRVLRALAAKLPKEQREIVLKTSIERIRELVPYNKARILEPSAKIPH